jgi:hypothetical protein
MDGGGGGIRGWHKMQMPLPNDYAIPPISHSHGKICREDSKKVENYSKSFLIKNHLKEKRYGANVDSKFWAKCKK